MERLVARRLCIFNTNFLFLLRRSKVSCNFISKISKKVFCIQIFSEALGQTRAHGIRPVSAPVVCADVFRALRVVRGRGARLAAHSADERQLRRAVPHPHSREDAGPRLRRAQFTAIFHHSAWVSPWWRARRYRLRAVHGSVNTRKPFLLPVRHRQRLRRRVFVPCPRLPRRRRLPLLPPQQAYPQAGSERQRLKS